MIKETIHPFRSVQLGNERSIWVRAPAGLAAPCNLVIVLDAELYRDNVGATIITDTLSRSGEIAPSIFVFVSMQSAAARWIECPCHPPFARFICDELLPWIATQYPTTRGATERVLVGLSYTGLAAAYVALQFPGVFTKIIAQSGSFWWNNCWLVEQFAQLKTRLPTAFYLDVGALETEVNVDHGEVQQSVSQIDAVKRLRDVLKNSGHSVSYVEFEGDHDPAKWRHTLPAALQWALPTATNP